MRSNDRSDISHCNIDSLASGFLSRVNTLKTLYVSLSEYRFSSPRQRSRHDCSNLRGNKVSKLDNSLDGFNRLQFLDLRENALEELDVGTDALASVTTLLLGSNRLNTLTSMDFSVLSELVTLYVLFRSCPSG
eukprot:gb/GECG01007247.1/.p1 GENE.gb/GECG01007247.1/~~gb/GECG01007247.1/.p1  ORF type:complete len:133 (+),score=11.71 gb/GECG01007247.1/:1-399(+)